MNNFFKLSYLCFALAFIVFSFGYASARAQTTPRFLISWEAENFVPARYPGKALPTKGTPVNVSFELIDGGNIANISGNKIRWYVNDNLVKNEADGLGIKSIQFKMPDYGGFETEVRISVVDYRRGSSLDNIIKIPSASPEVVIDAPYADLEIGSGQNIFEAIPFFFNINNLANLSYTWKANGQTDGSAGGASPWIFGIDIDSKMPKGADMAVSISAQSNLDSFEFAEKTLRFKIK